MLPLGSEPALNELLLRKEEEWRALQAHRTQLQEAALQDTRSQLEEAQGKLRCLQEDFIYNLQVLEERDLELERYDAAFAQAREWEEARRAEVSELKIEAAKLRQALAKEARKVEELQQQQQLACQEHRLELERVHSDKNGEIDHHREQYENLKWTLERKLEELDGELALQRQVEPLGRPLPGCFPCLPTVKLKSYRAEEKTTMWFIACILLGSKTGSLGQMPLWGGLQGNRLGCLHAATSTVCAYFLSSWISQGSPGKQAIGDV
ncbi:coiled-coil domain-containing protein 57-like isoform X3 [Hylobates moloch]|nr:coiled-coil domain-containing protein 57-like isoform X3 [Hylobates moloch]XP_058284253.1 coiled-coil domain-containing protein 57-like isoform X3 [Hylobates moloch]XP_058284254.1 coiled-coil domain-containing protein 57-like isoform X3 [Hylobates moloch]